MILTGYYHYFASGGTQEACSGFSRASRSLRKTACTLWRWNVIFRHFRHAVRFTEHGGRYGLFIFADCGSPCCGKHSARECESAVAGGVNLLRFIVKNFVFEYQNIESLAQYFMKAHRDTLLEVTGMKTEETPAAKPALSEKAKVKPVSKRNEGKRLCACPSRHAEKSAADGA